MLLVPLLKHASLSGGENAGKGKEGGTRSSPHGKSVSGFLPFLGEEDGICMKRLCHNTGMYFKRELAENLGCVRFLVVYFLYKTTKNICCRKKWPNCHF